MLAQYRYGFDRFDRHHNNDYYDQCGAIQQFEFVEECDRSAAGCSGFAAAPLICISGGRSLVELPRRKFGRPRPLESHSLRTDEMSHNVRKLELS